MARETGGGVSGGSGERIPRCFNAPCAAEPGKDAFCRVPLIPVRVRDAVERVLTRSGEEKQIWRTMQQHHAPGAGFYPIAATHSRLAYFGKVFGMSFTAVLASPAALLAVSAMSFSTWATTFCIACC